MAIEKLNLRADSQDERFAQLKQLYPELFSDGNLNVEALKEACGLETEEDGYYGLYWPGKNEAKRLARKEATGTLEPVEGDGVNEETTHNIYIEGDNLEVLRTLKKSYQNRVKMIYIDPPYNTGNDFIYPDNYSEPVEDYLRFTGQMDDKGNMLVANPKSSGKFHRRWLNMMYPRLQLARELLTDDGVIFISIDDNEQANLKLLCDDVFGEGNFISSLIWSAGRKNDSKHISVSHEYILCYFKSSSYIAENNIIWREKKNGLDDIYAEYEKLKKEYGTDIKKIEKGLKDWYKNLPNGHPAKDHAHYNHVDEKGIFFPDNISWPGGGGPKYEILHPITNKPVKVPSRGWLTSEENMKEWIKQGRVQFGEDENGVPTLKSYLKDREYSVPYSVFYKDGRAASKRLATLMDDKIFENPKDEEIIQRMIGFAGLKDNDIVLDFFSGSGTTAHSVFLANIAQNMNRQFILVQLPVKIEVDGSKSEKSKKVAQNAINLLEKLKKPYNICEIGKERIRRAGAKILEEAKANKDMFSKDNPLDLGFKVYRLAKSNFTVFENISGTDKSALDTLFAAAEKEPLTEGWKERKSSVITEICLHHGFVLDSAITKCPEYTKNEVLKIVDQNEEKTMFVCLDEKISEETAKTLHLEDGEKFICLDSAIGDQLKVQLADKGRIETI